MANIFEHLQSILSARYGRDVRQSIHDSIEAINAEVIDYGAKASEKADEAAQSAQDAAQSATDAAEAAEGINEHVEAASQAAATATQAVESIGDSAKYAQSYAVGGTGLRENENADNAKYYKEQVEQISQGLQGGLLPMGSIKYAALADQTKLQGYMFNIKDDFTTDETFKEGAGNNYPAGTNVYYTADGYWDCLAGVQVSGVKGDNEATYRKGQVNITADNIGLGNVPNVTTNKQTPTFTIAATRENIASGETLTNILGKIAKVITDLKSIAYSGSYNDLTDAPDINAKLKIFESEIDTKIENAGKPLVSDIDAMTLIDEYGKYAADAKTVGEEFAKINECLADGTVKFKVENGELYYSIYTEESVV